jgi:glycerophosphoryl diester phosphodiesterase
VIAHRGASGYRTENTLPAFALAVEQRADMIEIDLHRTRDAATVVIHDGLHPGLAGGIADASLDEVRRIDLGGGLGIPTLDEVLDAFAARIPFNLEIKRSARGAYPGLEAVAVEAVRARGVLSQTLFSCFGDDVLARLREIAPEARIALLLSPRSAQRPLERARALAAEALNPWLGLVTPELVRAAHAEGLAVYPFTVDAERDMRRLLEWGVDGLFTNYPDRLRRILEEESPGGSPRGSAPLPSAASESP